MKAVKALFLSILLAVAGCASTSTSVTPAQTVFAAKSAYATALTAAVAYRQLPACSSTVKAPCSEPSLVAQLQKADNVASASLDAAEAAVRTPLVGPSAQAAAIQAAHAALAALQAVVSNLRVTQ